MTTWVEKLLAWFKVNGRELPWREERTPYRTWVSEIMLQQTRVEAVRAYYTNWLEKFPTPETVAQASTEDVLNAWQGLGYYRRARLLQQAMQEVQAQYDGEIPSGRDELLALPGVGPYVMGAIRSLAFNEPEPAVDGNVLRVFARLYGITGNILDAPVHREVTKLVAEALPADRPQEFNEALMDFGALVCIPRAPRCGQCPLREECAAYRTGQTETLPVRRKKTQQQKWYAAVAVVARDGAFLLERRPDQGMLAGMWQFPQQLARTLTAAKEELFAQYPPQTKQWFWRHKHVFSHRIWELRAYRAAPPSTLAGDFRWVRPDEFVTLPMAGPHAKLAAYILDRDR